MKLKQSPFIFIYLSHPSAVGRTSQFVTMVIWTSTAIR